MQIVFWFCIGILVYIYFGYPLLLGSGLLGRRRPIRKKETFPSVSIVIPAHNEESVIEAKLRNLLSLDYPSDKLEILVGSDGSTDRTEELVRRFPADRVRLVVSPVQCGKSAIQNRLVTQSSGEIIVFTDADSLIDRDGLRRMMENFGDPQVGLVTISPSYSNPNETYLARNESLYWRYENWLRGQESERVLLAAATGWLFGMRRSLWEPLDPNVGDDFVLPLKVALQGSRNVVDETIEVESRLTQVESSSMLRMKVRIVSKDLRGLLANKRILNPFANAPLAIAMWSHKLLRWLVPYFLLATLVSNLFLLENFFYRIVVALQVLFYGIAVAGSTSGEPELKQPWSVPQSFCLVNLAALLGTLHCAAGRPMGVWKPVR